MESWFLFVLVGLACGVFSATFGVGSGIILIPVLVLAFSFPQKTAQGTCLAVMVPMAFVGALRYKLNPDVSMDLSAITFLSVGAVVGALIGATIAGWLPATVLRKLFAVIMIIAAIKMLMAPGAQKTPKKAATDDQTQQLTDTGGPGRSEPPA